VSGCACQTEFQFEWGPIPPTHRDPNPVYARFCCSGGSAWGPRCEYAICVPKSKPKLLHVLPASSSAFLINWVYSFRRLCLASLRSESPHLLHLIFLLHKYHMSMLPVSLRLCVFLPACFWCLGHLNVYGNYGLHKSAQNFIVGHVFSAGVQNCWLAWDWLGFPPDQRG